MTQQQEEIESLRVMKSKFGPSTIQILHCTGYVQAVYQESEGQARTSGKPYKGKPRPSQLLAGIYGTLDPKLIC